MARPLKNKPPGTVTASTGLNYLHALLLIVNMSITEFQQLGYINRATFIYCVAPGMVG